MMANPSIVQNTIFRGLLSFFNLAVPLLVVPYVYRVLSPETIGSVEYATTIFSYFNLFGVLGIYTYGLREVSKIRDDRQRVTTIYSNLFLIGLLSNLLVLLVYLISIYWIKVSLYHILIVLAFNFLANIFYTEWINEAFEDFRFIALKTVIVRSIYIAAIFLFVKQPQDVLIYVSIIVLSNFLNYIISFIYSFRYTGFAFRELSWSSLELKHHLLPLLLILVLNNSSVFYTMLDRIMLGVYNSDEAVAYYSVGQKIMEITRSVLMTLIFVSMPRLSYYLKKQYEDYLNGVRKLMQTILLLIIPIATGLILLSKSIVYLFAGEQYTAAIFPLTIFAFRSILLMIECVTAQQILFLHRKEKILVIMGLSWGMINLILNYVLVGKQIFSPTTAILTTAFSEICLIITELIYIKKYLNISVNIFNYNTLHYFLLSLLFIPVVLLLQHLVSYMIISFLLSVIVCGILYVFCLYKMRDCNLMEILYRFKVVRYKGNDLC